MLRLGIGLAIFILTLALIMIRPWRITEAIAALGGTALMLLFGFIGPGEATSVLAGQWNVYGFFLGLMAISALADQAGIFQVMAYQAGRWGRGQSWRLYLATFSVGVLITAFLSNDATALILTPVVYALVTRLRLPVLPFMFACTFIADTASFLLPVSNPINILVLEAFGNGLGTFLRFLLLPALFCILVNVALFMFLFRRDLVLNYDLDALLPPKINPGLFRSSLAALGIVALCYVAASIAGVPLSIVALGGSAVLSLIAWRYRCLNWQTLAHEISWSLFIFISGMFLVVRGVENLGVTAAFGHALLQVAGNSALSSIALFAAGTALGANLINNVPMALVMISTLDAIRSTAVGHAGLIYATILGADLGPNLTTVGSLATMLWLLILRRKGLEVSTLEYFKLGIVVVPFMVLIGAVLIWLNL